jgi:hypothetical protein
MITKENCIQVILQQVPEFRERWQAHLLSWEGEEPGLCNDLAEFSLFVVELLKDGARDGLPAIFDLIERLLVDGDDIVKDATATCFLEGLVNVAAARGLSMTHFADLLGPESQAYCKAWDDFSSTQGKE